MVIIPKVVSTDKAIKLVAGLYGASLKVEGFTTTVGEFEVPVAGDIELPAGAVVLLFNEEPDAVETPEPAGL